MFSCAPAAPGPEPAHSPWILAHQVFMEWALAGFQFSLSGSSSRFRALVSAPPVSGIHLPETQMGQRIREMLTGISGVRGRNWAVPCCFQCRLWPEALSSNPGQWKRQVNERPATETQAHTHLWGKAPGAILKVEGLSALSFLPIPPEAWEFPPQAGGPLLSLPCCKTGMSHSNCYN